MVCIIYSHMNEDKNVLFWSDWRSWWAVVEAWSVRRPEVLKTNTHIIINVHHIEFKILWNEAILIKCLKSNPGLLEKHACGKNSANIVLIIACFNMFNVKCAVWDQKCIWFYLKQMNVYLETIYSICCCTYKSNSEIKCPLSGDKRIMHLYLHVPTLNPTLNLTDSINKRRHEVKQMHLLKPPCQLILLLQVSELIDWVLWHVFHRTQIWVLCITTEKVYYNRHGIHMELVLWHNVKMY